MKVTTLLDALRPREWVKNAVVFAPLLFSGQAREIQMIVRSLVMFIAFCAAASAGYVVNDLRDLPFDREHSTKRRRPLASGRLAMGSAVAAAVLSMGIGIGVGLSLGRTEVLVIFGYLALTMSYSVVLKSVVILDVMAIAGGFLLRVVGGAVAIDAEASRWLIVCTGMAALFLGFTKRRQEAIADLGSGQRSRPVLAHYSCRSWIRWCRS